MIAAIAIAYALGSIPTAYLLVRSIRGEDIRETGSGNVGATNAGRVLGPAGFVAALAGDVLKGTVAVLVARALGVTGAAAWAVALAVVVGHVWPITLRFRGGKGIGPGIGAVLAIDPRLAAVAAGVFGLLFAATRRYQPSGLAAVALVPALAVGFGYAPAALAGVLGVIAVVLVAHRHDVTELLRQPSPRS